MFGSAAEAKAARDAGFGQSHPGGPNGRGGWSGPTGMRGAGGFASPDGRLSQRADVKARNPGTTDAAANAAARAWANRVSDYRNTYNSRLDNIGNMIARSLDFNEIAPSFDVGNLANDTDWGFDPVGGLAGLAGSAFGGPLGGLLAGRAATALSDWAGRPLEVNLGPHVFGGASSGTNATRDANSLRADPARTNGNSMRSNLVMEREAYQRAQGEAMRRRHLRQSMMESRQAASPQAMPRGNVPPTMLGDNVAGLPAYGALMPGYGKANGYGGTARPAPIDYPTSYA